MEHTRQTRVCTVTAWLKYGYNALPTTVTGMTMTHPSSELTHFDKNGHAHMVDIGNKVMSKRTACCEGRICMQVDTLAMVEQGGHKKGDVLGIARLAGIMAAKKTADLIPLCHPIMLTKIKIDFNIDKNQSAIVCTARVDTTERTGIEIEALTAVQIALVTIYDMCKSVDRGMEITGVRLLHKAGGKSGEWKR